MAFSIGELVGFVKIDHSGVKSGMDAAGREVKAGMDRTGAAADKSGKDVGKKFGDGVAGSVRGSLKTLSTAIVGAFAVDRVVSFVGDSIKAASDLEQSIGGVDAVFGEYAANVHEKSRQAAQDLGLSKNAYNELITVSGAMLKNKGLDDFAEQSQNLVKIGADLAAQFGGPTSQAVEALNAAMRGESDPIERYGISLNEAAVNAKMAQMGLEGLEGAALDQAKTQARLALITEQSTDAQGAFAREADTAAGKAQRLSAEWENQQVALGEKLLPAMVAVTDFASGTLVPAFSGVVELFAGLASAANSLPGPVKTALLALVAFHLLKGPVVSMLDTTRTKIDGLGKSLKGGGIAGGAKAAGGALMSAFGGPLGIAIGVGTMALTHFWQEAEKVNAIADTLAGTVDKATGAFTKASRTEAKKALFGDLSVDDRKLLEGLGVDFDALADSALKGGDAYKQQRAELVDLMEQHQGIFTVFSSESKATEGLLRSYDRLGEGARDSADEAKRLADDEKDVGDEAKGAAPKVDNLADKTAALKTKSEEAAEKTKKLAEAILDVVDAAVDSDSAEIDYEKTLDSVQERIAKRIQLEKDLKKETDPKERARLKEELKEYAASLDTSTKAGQDNLQGLIDLATQARDSAEAMLANNEGVKATADTMLKRRKDFVDLAMQMNGGNKKAAEDLADKYGLTADKVKAMSDEMGKVPAEVVTDLKADISQAEKEIASLKRQLDLLKGKTITINVKSGTIRASGVNSSGPGRGFLEGNERFGGALDKYASGGLITGPGTSTSDSILAFIRETGNAIAVSNREFVSTGSSTARNRAALEAGNAGAMLGVMTPGSGAPAGPVDLSRKSARMIAQELSKVRIGMDVDRMSSALAGG